MLASRLLLCLSLTICAPSFGTDAESNPARRQPVASAAADVQPVIVKFREEGSGVAAANSGAATSKSAREARSIGERSGRCRGTTRQPDAEASRMRWRRTRMPCRCRLPSGESLATTLARLRADPAVEYAEPDYRRFIHAAPNDPLFQTQQWHLKNDSSTPSAIDAVSAWDMTQGADGIVVAVVDTGVRFDHPDLKRVSAGGRLLDGYDFITDPRDRERRRRARRRRL